MEPDLAAAFLNDRFANVKTEASPDRFDLSHIISPEHLCKYLGLLFTRNPATSIGYLDQNIIFRLANDDLNQTGFRRIFDGIRKDIFKENTG